jgi:Domain of unknown function (DUF4440)
MKKICLSLLAVLVLHVVVIAQAKSETAVAATVEKLRVAMIDGNKAVLESIAADGLSYGHSSGAVENKAVFVENIVSGKNDFVTIDLTDQTISVTGKTAVVRHKFKGSMLSAGRTSDINIGILLVFQKEKKEWKLLARQAFRLP